MKHITFGDKSLLIGDQTADLLLNYAAALGQNATADTVDVNAISSDGDEVVATFLLNEGTTIMAETTNSSAHEPDNAEVISYMTEHLRLLKDPPSAVSETPNEQQRVIDESDFDFDQTYES